VLRTICNRRPAARRRDVHAQSRLDLDGGVWLLAVALRQLENLDAAGGDANRVRDLRDGERRPCARRASVCTCVNGISLEPANGAI
jgi:hypothetical protein